MQLGRFRTDPTFDEFVWLAPMHCIGALGFLVAVVSGGLALGAGEPLTAALRGLPVGFILVPLLGLAVAAMNMVVAYLPSVVTWHLTLRLTLAHLGRRGAVRAAAAVTAVTASLILALWGSILLLPGDRSTASDMQTYSKAAAIVMAVSVIASIWTADRIEEGRHR